MKKYMMIVWLMMGLSLYLNADINIDTPQGAKKACEGGYAGGCHNLGKMYDSGEGVKKDVFKAVKFYKKSCEGGYAEGCVGLGFMYELGKGVRQNTSRAKELYGKACDGGVAFGCEKYARLN